MSNILRQDFDPCNIQFLILLCVTLIFNVCERSVSVIVVCPTKTFVSSQERKNKVDEWPDPSTATWSQ